MRLTILAAALLTAFSAQAEFVYKLPLEAKLGGHLADGSISFTNKPAPVEPSEPETPVEPSEPVVVDPFEQVDPKCDPYAVGYPGNSTSKDLTYGTWYANKNLGKEYRSCKLKEVEKPNMLARFASIIPSYLDECNPNATVIKQRLFKKACSSSGAGILEFYYFVAQDAAGNNSYTNYTVQVFLNPAWPFTMNDVDRIEFDGVTCNNLRYMPNPVPIMPPTNMVLCDSNISYSELASKMDKQIIVEIYGKK
ncbi:hypothetical protein [Pseudomonas putida]|uniref:hypothetical protein n=1 Tax=Pseudomonas putida TaxID=303 RepID=UPI0037C5963B